jgi:hypothetical protein
MEVINDIRGVNSEFLNLAGKYFSDESASELLQFYNGTELMDSISKIAEEQFI